jgi:hypothetical protein
MKPMQLSILFFITTLLSSLSAFAFEGIIKVNYHTYQGSEKLQDCQWMFKDKSCKFSITLQGEKEAVKTDIIPRMSDKHLLIYNTTPAADGKHYYASVDVKNVQPDPTFTFSSISVESLKDTMTLHGLLCKKYVIRTNRSTTEMWLSLSDIPFYQYAAFFPSNFELAGLAKAGISGFPMKSITHDLGGNVLADFEVTEIIREALPDAAFSVPSGYQEFSAHRE